MSQPWDPSSGSEPADSTGGQQYGQQPGYDQQQPGYGQQQSYQQGGYQQPGYPQQGQAYGGHQQPAYPGMQQQGYGAPAPGRPGAVTAGAVLAFVQAGMVLIASIIALGSGVATLGDEFAGGVSTGVTILAVFGLVCAALLIVGGAKAFGGVINILVAGCGLSLLLSVVWLIYMTSNGLDFGLALIWPLIYAILPAIAVGMAMSANTQAWARTKKLA